MHSGIFQVSSILLDTVDSRFVSSHRPIRHTFYVRVLLTSENTARHDGGRDAPRRAAAFFEDSSLRTSVSLAWRQKPGGPLMPTSE